MNLQDLIAIATFAIAIMGVVYAFGQRDARLATLEKDTNSIGNKLDREVNDIHTELKELDKRADSQSLFVVAIDQRVRQIQEAILGQERTDRLRETPKADPHYTVDDGEGWYSDNSGINL